MRTLSLSPLLLASLVACGGEPIEEVHSDIVGGAATSITRHPWQVSLSDASGHFCGGSIIAPEWILTAAHCLEGADLSELWVTAGVTLLGERGQRRTVDRAVSYPGYVTPELGRDVALLHLGKPLTLGSPKVRAIALATPRDVHAKLTTPGVRAIVSGWGDTQGGAFDPEQLLQVTVPIVPNHVASRAYAMPLGWDQLAAGSRHRDSCQGDSGGPLTVADTSGGRVLAGVVSWGHGCGEAGYPGLYARVSAFEGWIRTQIAP